MTITFDSEAIDAAFSQPASNGSYSPEFAAYLGELGKTRPSVVLAFAPKAAGTYLRSAAIEAVGGQLVRTTYALGGRDASFYLPTLLNYYAHGFPSRTMVTHVHMQALHANVCMIEALDLRPVIMMRPIADMLASYWDMLDGDHLSPDNWLNIEVPSHFEALADTEKGNFMVDMVAPWYVSYFSTWVTYARRNPGRVLTLHYDGFLADPTTALEDLLAHSRMDCSRKECGDALELVWPMRSQFRYNKGVSGRGRDRFDEIQLRRLRSQMSFYPELLPDADRLIPLS